MKANSIITCLKKIKNSLAFFVNLFFSFSYGSSHAYDKIIKQIETTKFYVVSGTVIKGLKTSDIVNVSNNNLKKRKKTKKKYPKYSQTEENRYKKKKLNNKQTYILKPFNSEGKFVLHNHKNSTPFSSNYETKYTIQNLIKIKIFSQELLKVVYNFSFNDNIQKNIYQEYSIRPPPPIFLIQTNKFIELKQIKILSLLSY